PSRPRHRQSHHTRASRSTTRQRSSSAPPPSRLRPRPCPGPSTGTATGSSPRSSSSGTAPCTACTGACCTNATATPGRIGDCSPSVAVAPAGSALVAVLPNRLDRELCGREDEEQREEHAAELRVDEAGHRDSTKRCGHREEPDERRTLHVGVAVAQV